MEDFKSFAMGRAPAGVKLINLKVKTLLLLLLLEDDPEEVIADEDGTLSK
jgi:hypothetical protein